MDQGIGWLIVVLIWSLPFLVGAVLVFVLFFKHFRKKHPPLAAFLLTCLAVAAIACLLMLKSLFSYFLLYASLPS